MISGFKKSNVFSAVVIVVLLLGCAKSSRKVSAEASDITMQKEAQLNKAQRISVAHEFFVRGRLQELKGNEKR